jgi:L,D-peptidoglycan transpeptidase YkuD (ErfK/YbiS/YcfS/YnhG family)
MGQKKGRGSAYHCASNKVDQDAGCVTLRNNESEKKLSQLADS